MGFLGGPAPQTSRVWGATVPPNAPFAQSPGCADGCVRGAGSPRNRGRLGGGSPPWSLTPRLPKPPLGPTRNSAELSHSSKGSGRRRNTPTSAQNRSESLCAALWIVCRIFWAWFGPALGQIPIRNRRFPAGSFPVFGALVARPRNVLNEIPAAVKNVEGKTGPSRKVLLLEVRRCSQNSL